jgi:KaiC/GvpD/RAD55 family RecA-like ATPase
MEGQLNRIKTYINGFDEAISGGIPEKHITLISGTAGTMKSSLCFNIIYNEALAGRNSLYISLEQSFESLQQHMDGMGLNSENMGLLKIDDLTKIDQVIRDAKASGKGNILLADVGCIRKEIKDIKVGDNKSWMNVIKNIVKKVKAEIECKVFVLDSMSALYVLSRFENPRIELFYIFEFLRDMGLTTYLISEMPLDGSQYSEFGIEDFLSDGIIHLRLSPFRRKMVREISVPKMRATNCNNDVFSLEFKNGQFNALYGGQNPLL